jgi:hypothetical protein
LLEQDADAALKYHEDHPPIAGSDAVGRLPSDRLSIAKGHVTAREQHFHAK